MGDANKSLEFTIAGNAQPFVSAMERAAGAALSGSGTIKGHVEGIGNAFASVQKHILALAAVVAGGAFFKDAIAESNKLTGETMMLSRRLGMTAEAATTLNTALGDIGSDAQTYTQSFDNFGQQLRGNEDQLKKLGLATRDSNGNLRDSNELFQDAVRLVGEYKPGIDQTTAAMMIFGSSVDDVLKLGKLNNEVLEEAKQKNEELGLVITKEGVEASKAYKAAMNDVGDVLTAVKKVIGDAVMPIFAELGKYFAEAGPYFISIFRGALTGLVLTFRAVQLGVKVAAAVIFESINTIIDQVGNMSNLLAAVFRGDFSGAAAIWHQMGQRVVTAIRNVSSATVEAFHDAQAKFASQATTIWGGGTKIGAPKGGTRRMGAFNAGKDDKDGGKDESRMKLWEAQLEERKLQIAEQARAEGTFREMSKAEELKYWQDIRKIVGDGDKELAAVRKKVATAGLEVDKQAFEARMEDLRVEREAMEKNYVARSEIAAKAYTDTAARYGVESKEAKKAYGELLAEHRAFVEQDRQLTLGEADARRAARAGEIELERIAAAEMESLGLATQEQTLEREQQFEERLHELKLQGLRERQALVDRDRDPLAYQQASAAIEEAEIQHQQRMAQIRVQTRATLLQPLTSGMESLKSSWASLIDQFAHGSLTIAGLIRGVFRSVVDVVIQSFAKMAAQWLINKLMMSLAGKVSALEEVTRESGKAGAAGTASMAAAPFPLNLGAPAFGAAMAAAAMAYAPMASAEGGYDIPGSVNPIVQLHQREMVLPARYADAIRGLADDGGAPADAAPIVIRTVGGVGDWLMANRHDLARVMDRVSKDRLRR